MNLVDTIEAMRLAGVPAEQILATVQAISAKLESDQRAKEQERRERNAERQRKSRASRNVTVTARDSA